MKGRTLLAGVVAALLASGGVTAQDSRQTQRQLDQVKRELRQVATERRRLEGERGQANRALRDADEQVGASTRALARTNARILEQQARLQALKVQRRTLDETLGERRAELQRLLRAAYTVGQDAPLKVLLAQDHGAQARRLLAWHGYVQRHRAARIAALHEEIASLDTLEEDIARTSERLDHERREQQQQVARLERDRQARAEAVAQLDSRYSDRRERERALGSDARALEQVLAQLRAAARRAEAERRAAAERAAREARQAQSPPARGRSTGSARS
ncbi:MAG: peptidase M23, partial [Pseudoxanthomonas suwonensis]|nr:peptidase M23 [Pseudoxanthomonas suwonensis]